MTRNPSTLKANLPVAHALHLMALHHFRHVPLVDDENRPIGMVSFRNVVDFIQKYF
jgi:CBS domain-containing protein